MYSSIGFFHDTSDSDSDEQLTPTYIHRKSLRLNSNPLDIENKIFLKLFRVSKKLFKFILNQAEPHFVSRRHIDAIPPILKVAATLRFLAEGSYQQGVGQDFVIGMAQPTVSIVIAETLEILESKMCKNYINFNLSEEEKAKSQQYFFNKMGFPGVIGCVDGTHVNILRPNNNEHHYFNRKGNHSINVMMTCDYKMEIISVDPRYGGCSHDSAIWNMSDNLKILEEKWRAGDKSSWILGDSGYPLQPWLMIPYRKATEGSPESHYNTIHSKTRSIIERVIGIIKGRWRCLLHTRELHYQPLKATQIINVCVLLHNLCMRYNVEIDESLIVTEQTVEHNSTNEIDVENLPQESRRIRDEIRDNLQHLT